MDERTFTVKPPSGWYRVPSDPAFQRYWDGTDWTGKPQKLMPYAKDFPGVERVTQHELDRRRATVPGDSSATRQRNDAIEEFAYWQQRVRFLEHLAIEARQRQADAAAKVKELGISRDELANWKPVPAAERARAGGAGGFFFAYSESGVDLDGDGLVDGGLFESISDMFGD